MSKVKVFNSIKEFILFRDSLAAGTKVGFVPTMGALHEGHASLLRRSRTENDLSVLSIYVNPTQFNNPEDLKKYPKTWEADLALAGACGVDAVISPLYEEMYADQYRYQLIENDFSKKLCGAHRPGHFNGVLTVVMKLFQIAQPRRAYFGEKDFQQLQLIQDMASTFFLRTEVVGCPTVREADGLAMSSRNTRLSAEGRKKAPLIFKALTDVKKFDEAKALLATENIELEYLEEHFNRRFIAAHLEGVRLIDNVKI
ncbi:MAG: pantoate--beta-alanine ligase [Pseudobdellovibrio sp.]